MAERRKPGRVLQGVRADYDALGAPAQRLGDVFVGAQTAAELARYARCGDDAADALAIDRPPLLGTVQVDDVEIGRPLLDPTTSHGGGISAKDSFSVVIALSQPHALAAAHVDGRQYEHVLLPIRTRSSSAGSGTREGISAFRDSHKKEVYRSRQYL